MAWHTPRTWNVGELVTKVMMDEQIRDNMNALMKGAAAGDVEYFDAANSKVALPAPATVNSHLTNTPAGAVAWASKGIFSNIGYASFAPGSSRTAATFADITGATLDLVLAAGNTYTVIAIAGVSAWVSNSAYTCQICAHIDGVIDPNQLSITGTVETNGVSVGYLRTGIAAGTRTVKLQYRVYSAGATAHVERGWLIGVAVTE